MPTMPIKIQIDSDIKSQASNLFEQLGLDMSTAVNLFLYQSVLCRGLPFRVEIPTYSQSTLAAMEEAR